MCYGEIGELFKALLYYKIAHQINEKIYDKNHSKARQLFERVPKNLIKTLPTDHQLIFICYEKIMEACCYTEESIGFLDKN